MVTPNPFDPAKDGWSFENFDTTDLTWDQYRRTYLAINPTNDPVEAPFDYAFYQIFKSCAKNGNCGGMSGLALAIYGLGGYFGYGAPAFFYAGGSNLHPPPGPARSDLYDALNIMQARQFSAPGIQNFVDVVKAGQLNDGVAAFTRIQDGLANGDFQVLSLSNGLFGTAAHTIVPYRADISGNIRTLHVWDPNRPYDDYKQYYDDDHNKIVITAPTQWSYDQTAGGTLNSGEIYKGSNNGWFFSVPTSLIRQKARQPISVGFAITNLTLLFVTGTGSISQVEDDEGRRLFGEAAMHAGKTDLEADEDRRLDGVMPWPWTGGVGGKPPGDLLIIERSPGSRPLTVTVDGGDYRLQYLANRHLTEFVPHGDGASDRIRLGDDEGGLTFEAQTAGSRRLFDFRHVRDGGGGDWRGVRVGNAHITRDAIRLRLPASGHAVQLSADKARRDINIAFEQRLGTTLKESILEPCRCAAGGTRLAEPAKWTGVATRKRRRSAK
jgi:hypothetical protein